MKLIDIAFDLDGTLCHIMPVFEEIIWDKYKAKVPKTRSFKIETEPELEYEKILECFTETFKRVDDIPIAEGVRELFNKLYSLTDRKDPIHIVTARPLFAANDTYRLVQKICKNVEWEVVIVENSDNKIKHLNRYDNFVDDRRKTCLHLSSYEKIVWMPIRNYNQPLPNNYPETLMPIETLEHLIPWANSFIKEV